MRAHQGAPLYVRARALDRGSCLRLPRQRRSKRVAAAAARAGGGGGEPGAGGGEGSAVSPSLITNLQGLDCAVAPVVHIVNGKWKQGPQSHQDGSRGGPNPQGLALYVITEEIIVSLPALTHRQRG